MSERRLRLAVVIQTPKDAQSAVYIGYQSLATALEEHHHSVTIVAPGDFPSVARVGGRWTPFVYPAAVASWLHNRRDDFDLVMFHSYAGWLATRFARGRARALVMFHGVEPMYHSELRAEAERTGGRLSWRYRFLQERVMPFFLKTACQSADAVACLNRAEADYLTSRAWVANEHVRVLAHGVPSEFFVADRERRPIQTLLFVGQWLPMKGIRYLREAAAVLLKDGRTRLVCAGTLASGEQVKAEFAAPCRDRIEVLPRVDQSTLAKLYREADVFVFPSLYEGFSRAIAEAMASRLPIVCTNVGVASDALHDGESALIVPKHDAAALVTAVRRLQSDPELANRLADTAADAARDFTLARVAKRTIEVIMATAGGEP